MKHAQALSSVVIAFAATATVVDAQVVTTAFDPGATAASAAPNAIAAATGFYMATQGVGPVSLIDVESISLGSFEPSLVLSPLVTLTTAPTTGWTNQITDDTTTPTNGFNTTPQGSRFIKIDPNETRGTLYFNFSEPIAAFSALFSGLGDHGGTYRFRTNDSAWEGRYEAGASDGGLLFFGISHFAQPTTSVSIEFLDAPDHIGIDDIRVVVPSPPSLGCIMLLAGCAASRRRRC